MGVLPRADVLSTGVKRDLDWKGVWETQRDRGGGTGDRGGAECDRVQHVSRCAAVVLQLDEPL